MPILSSNTHHFYIKYHSIYPTVPNTIYVHYTIYHLHIHSGCSKDQQRVLKALYKKLFPYYYIHFTPDYKLTGFHYSNKPNGELYVCYNCILFM